MTDGWAAIARFGGIGDNLIASAVLPGLKAKYDRVEVITQRPQHVVFENNPYIDKLAVYSPGDIPGGDNDVWQDWFTRRAKEYAFFQNLSHTCETRVALLRGQTDFYRSPSYRRKYCAHNYLEVVADACDIPYETLSPGFFPTDEEHLLAEDTKQRYNIWGPTVGWILSGTRVDKIHPYAPMIIERLIRETGCSVIVLGAPSPRELEMAEAIQEHIRQRLGSTLGLFQGISESFENETWPIRRVMTMAQHCDIVIGPDTGPMWGVASLDIPKIMLLSHASPENITKYWRNTTTLHADPLRVDCWPCHRLIDTEKVLEHCRPNRDGNGVACISDISIQTVVDETKRLLKEREKEKESSNVHDRKRSDEAGREFPTGLNGSSKSRRRRRLSSPEAVEGRTPQSA